MPLGMLILGLGISSATGKGNCQMYLKGKRDGSIGHRAWQGRTMGAAVGSADRESAIEHASKEDEAVARVAGRVLPLFPDEVMAGVAGACGGLW